MRWTISSIEVLFEAGSGGSTLVSVHPTVWLSVAMFACSYIWRKGVFECMWGESLAVSNKKMEDSLGYQQELH